MELGTAIKKLRKEKNINQKLLAEKCNISVNALCNIEKNISFPQKRTIDSICEALSIPLSYLLFFSITEDDIPNESKVAFSSLNNAVKAVLLDSISLK
ncbi:Transcriptional regulator, contains XRE-family HTH domain [Tenacibaculum sp. MAR_2010_89]|uniref:helix-turn-helix domain-containing protein n=1 Tax=Tenacibaculum sp. MAR_2010_89 TaxID=1250198 RepID=UPI0008949F37|nr:helix-turn-helix transcriptional regulator [Tenacibaculum sp. MAR_2010_89]SEE66443.1 Transcriptional regulator, contains XRE-family HTH domain [Tenacibaculum sp. MAR_2010_89]